MELIFLIVIIFVIAVASIYFQSYKSRAKTTDKAIYHYSRKQFIMTRAENEFYQILVNAVGNSFNVFPQIHLSAILDEKIKGQNWKAAFRHINGKSVDYVLCDKQYNQPKVAIELDDLSHDEESRRLRDEEEERIFKEVNLPLLRIKDFKRLSNEDIKKLVLEKLS